MTEKGPNEAVILGRTVKVATTTPLQIAMMTRMGKLAAAKGAAADAAESAKDKDSVSVAIEEGLQVISQLLDSIEHLLVEPADREWLVQETLRGNVEIEDLAPLLQAAGAGMQDSKGPAKKANRVTK